MCVSSFFFFKHKTADEMRISDWSSDVCSSDLKEYQPAGGGGGVHREQRERIPQHVEHALDPAAALPQVQQERQAAGEVQIADRLGDEFARIDRKSVV